MKRLRPTTLLVASCAVALHQGCTFKVSANRQAKAKLGTHSVVVKPGTLVKTTSSSSLGAETTHRFTCGDVKVVIRNEEFIVNDKTYGLLSPSDAVLVDRGRVYVENRPVEGRTLWDEEKLERSPVKETTGELAGYRVAVRPGSMMTTETQFLGKHTLKVGEPTVSIKNDRLFVNDKPYGTLKPGDTVLVENGKVFVSGQERASQ